MKKLLLLILTFIFLLTIPYIAQAAGQDQSNLSLEVSYLIPYNSSNTDSIFSLGFNYPLWKILRLSGDANFDLFKNSNNTQPPSLDGGIGVNIPLTGFNIFADLKEGFSLNSNGINDYCDIFDLGIALPLTDNFTFISYFRNCSNFAADTITSSAPNYLGLGLDFKF